MNIMRLLTGTAAAAMAALCAGCLSSSAPESKAWLVSPRTDLPTAVTPEGASAFSATRLGQVTVCAPFDRPPFAVRRGDGTIAFDAYNIFAAAPAMLLRAPVHCRLAADGRFGHVIGMSSVAFADAQVEVTVTDLSLDCRDSGKRTARAALSLNVIKAGRGPREIAFTGAGSGEADAGSGDYSAAFSAAFDAAMGDALRALK